MTENLKAANPPIREGEVVISFLGDNFLAGSVVDLGVHLLDKNIINNQNIASINYQDINEYNYMEKGFQTLEFDTEMMNKLNGLYKKSIDLEKDEKIDENDEELQKYINILEKWIEQQYAILTGETDIQAVCSRHLIMRIAGCDKTSCQIPGNPLSHLDYISFDATYDRQCLEQEEFIYKTNCPEKENLIDVVNIWFPTVEVQDWPLGFIDIDSVEIKDYVPIELVVGSKSCSLRFKPDLNVIYKDKMKPSEVYFFRSATKDATKKGVFHSSFRITDEKYERRSIELRCCIFKKNTMKNVVGGRKYKTKKPRKYIKKRTYKKHKIPLYS
jgi:hypothetical protein